jgi:hypothetical protein
VRRAQARVPTALPMRRGLPGPGFAVTSGRTSYAPAVHRLPRHPRLPNPAQEIGSGGVKRVGGNGMNSVSPGTWPMRCASQSALAWMIRSLRLETKFHHM